MSKHILLCVRLADAERVHPKMRTDFFCDNCFRQLAVFPSGVSIIRKHGRAKIQILCSHCGPQDVSGAALAPGAENEPAETYRKRSAH